MVMVIAMGLISCCLVMGVLVAFSIDTCDSSDHFFKQTVEKAPEKHVQRAYSLIICTPPSPFVERKDVLEAIEECNLALKLNPDYARAFAARASAYEMLNRREDALRDCDTAIRLDPENPHRYVQRSIYNGLSLNELNKAIELDPTECVFYSMRAGSKCLDRDLIGALFDYGKYIRLSKSKMRFESCVKECWYYLHSSRKEQLEPLEQVKG